MVVAKKKVGRPPKAKSFIQKLRENDKKALAAARKKLADTAKANSKQEKIPSLEIRISKLERILEDAVNAGRELHKKIDGLSKVRQPGWQPHEGDKCPIHEDNMVEVLLRDGKKNGPHPAWKFLWKECGAGTIVAFKVH